VARKNLIVSFLSSVPGSVRDMLKDDAILAPCPVTQAGGNGYPGGREGYRLWLSKYMDGQRNVIPGIALAHGLREGDEVGKVCVMGFSNGCIGVDEVLGANDSQRIDVTLAVDGVHGSFDYNKMPVAAQYKNYMNQAAHVGRFNAEADRNAPVMAITHSSIDPLAYPSTTVTAELIWNAVFPRLPNDYIPGSCGWGCVPWLHLESIKARYADPVEKCSGNGCFTWYGIEDGWYERRSANNFYVLGWGYPLAGKAHTKDPAGYADHVFQGHVVLHALLTEFVVQRWNAKCGALSGLGQSPGEGGTCVLPQGQSYGTASSQKVDYFPDLNSGTPLPNPCPLPPIGKIIVGKPGNPCALEDSYVLPGAPEQAETAKPWLAAAAGFAAGYGLAWYGNKLYRTR
jgi:hypothetical protein